MTSRLSLNAWWKELSNKQDGLSQREWQCLGSLSTWLTACHISTYSAVPILYSHPCLLLSHPTSFPCSVIGTAFYLETWASFSTPPYSPYPGSKTFINIPGKVSPFQAHWNCCSDTPSLPLTTQITGSVSRLPLPVFTISLPPVCSSPTYLVELSKVKIW